MGLFQGNRPKVGQKNGIPVWFMRQAGRYHSHYQGIKAKSDFMSMCKDPRLAADITHGPIQDFKFDAAILFSDLLFPLEQLGLGLSYHSGPPTLERHLHDLSTVEKLQTVSPAKHFYAFQKEACTILRKELSEKVTLLGFVGGPFTLYTYACEGAHAGNLLSSKAGLFDGRYQAFMRKLLPELVEEMCVQAEGGADAVCLFDTAVGELTLDHFKRFAAPSIREVTAAFKKRYPQKKVVYYSKLTHINYLRELEDKNVDVLGVDWRMDLRSALQELSKDYYVQGNFDPAL